MMDFKSKGRLWANNISKKFNTIRQEVDNIVNQDSVKFSETQVQTVGQSMKKVCSEVVELVGPVKCEAQAVAPKGTAAYKKSIIGTEKNDGHKSYFQPMDLSNKSTFDAPSLVDQTTAPTLLGGNIDDVLTDDNYYPRIEETAMENSSAPDTSDLIASCDNDSSRAILSHELIDNENTSVSLGEETPLAPVHGNEEVEIGYCNTGTSNENSCVTLDEDATSTPVNVQEVEIVHCNTKDISDSISNISNENSKPVNGQDFQPSQKVENVHCNTEGVSDSISMSSTSLGLSEMSSVGSSCVSFANTESCADALNVASDCSSLLVSSALAPVVSSNKEEEEMGPTNSNCVLSMESTDRLASSLSLVYPPIDCCNLEEADTVCSSCSTYVVDDEIDPGMETICLFDQLKPEESCVVVDNSMLYEVVRRIHRQRSYKKKIADMFNTRKRLSKEYEQLAIWCGDIDTESIKDTENLNSDQVQLSQDSEWELL